MPDQPNQRVRSDYIYGLDVIKNIKKQHSVFILPDRTKRVISKITKEVSSPKYDKKPVFKKSSTKHKCHSQYSVVKQENIEHVPQIRAILNKITKSNVVNLTDEIIMKLDLVTKNDIQNVVENIFKIASNNYFFSECYAYIFQQIKEKHEYINELLFLNIHKIIHEMLSLYDIDPNEDYDKYCINMKINEKHKAFFCFITFILKLERHTQELQYKVIESLLLMTHEFCKKTKVEGKINACNQIVEIIYVCFKDNEVISLFKTHSKFKEIQAQIHIMASFDRNQCSSMSNKVYFKLMDVVDLIK